MLIPRTNNYYVKVHSNIAMEKKVLSLALLDASQSIFGNVKGRHNEWFDDSAAGIRSPIHDKYAAHDALLRNLASRTLHERQHYIRATAQCMPHWMVNN